MVQSLKEDVLNLPNVLTMGRIVIIPFVVLFMEWSDMPGDPTAAQWQASLEYCFWAALLFAMAAATDYFDGWLARNLNKITILGKLLDPIADKLIVMATLVTLTALHRVPAWIVVLLLAREFGINGLRSIASSEGLSLDVIQAGKWKTAFQLCGLIGLLVHHRIPIDFLFAEVSFDFHNVGLILLIISLGFSLWSAFAYSRSFFRSVAAKYRAGADLP